VGGGVHVCPLGTAFTNMSIVSVPGGYDNGEIGGMFGRGNRSTEKTCPSASLSTTNPTCCPDAIPGHRGEKPATNRLSYGTANSAADIATDYGLDDRGVGVRVSVESRIFSSSHCPDRVWGPPNFVSNGHRGLFPRG
jgi:hypothetical protein